MSPRQSRFKSVVKVAVAALVATVCLQQAGLLDGDDLKTLKEQAEIVRERVTDEFEARAMPLEIMITHEGRISTGIYDTLAAAFDWIDKPAHPKELKALEDPRSVRALDAHALGKCVVVASAMSMSEGTQLRRLADALQDKALAWRIALTHETAHCLRNPKSAAAESLDWRIRVLSDYLAEAYADDFALTDILLEQPARAPMIFKAVKAWRSSPDMGPSHRTFAAVDSLVRITANTPSIKRRERDAMAWEAATQTALLKAAILGVDGGSRDFQELTRFDAVRLIAFDRH